MFNQTRDSDVDGSWTLITRLVSRLGYTGRHRAEPTVGRHGYGEGGQSDIADNQYVSVEDLLSPDC